MKLPEDPTVCGTAGRDLESPDPPSSRARAAAGARPTTRPGKSRRTSRLARIAEDIPLDRAVSTPHLGELANGRDERIGLGRIDAVIDLDEHRTFIGLGGDVDVRLWPVHRRCEVKRAGSIERPAPDRGESQDEARGRHGERLGRAEILGDQPPRGAAGPKATLEHDERREHPCAEATVCAAAFRLARMAIQATPATSIASQRPGIARSR